MTFVIEEDTYVTEKVTNDTLKSSRERDRIRPYQTGNTVQRAELVNKLRRKKLIIIFLNGGCNYEKCV